MPADSVCSSRRENGRMRGPLGEKIGEGTSADIHAWAPGQVVKLFKAGVPERLSRWEARMTRAVFAAGGPAQEVLDEVELGGRFASCCHASTGRPCCSSRAGVP